MFSFGMVMIEVGGVGSSLCHVVSPVVEGIHWQYSVQQFYYRRSHSKHHLWGASKAVHPPQFHRPLVDIDAAVLGTGTARPPAHG